MKNEIKHSNKAKIENEQTIKKLQSDVAKQSKLAIEKNKSNEIKKPIEETIKPTIATIIKEEKKENNTKTVTNIDNLADTEKIVHKLRSELMEKDMNNKKLYEQLSQLQNQLSILAVLHYIG